MNKDSGGKRASLASSPILILLVCGICIMFIAAIVPALVFSVTQNAGNTDTWFIFTIPSRFYFFFSGDNQSTNNRSVSFSKSKACIISDKSSQIREIFL